jgi:hypothetical protein
MVFEIFFADGLEAGPSAKREFLFFFKKITCAERPWQRLSAKTVFLFF